MMKLRFLGAAGTVTGSKYLIETRGHRFMIDCGLFQGQKEIRARNWQELPIDPTGVEAVVLTHAHIDHTGYLPRLTRDGFEGPIHCTDGTLELTELLLRDSARLQEEQANYMNRKRLSKHKPALPLYSIVDAEDCLRHLEPHRYHQPFEVVPGVKVTYSDAGHILGSAWLALEIGTHRIVFSGDLGRREAPILRDPEPPGRADYLILESTYGDRLHGEHDIEGNLMEIIRRTVDRRGVLVIPAFAVERTQEILYILNGLARNHTIPRVPVFIDSPMAVRATRTFRKFPQYYDEEAAARVANGDPLLEYPNLKLCESVAESKAILDQKPPFIVISASGMATGGRILHHLKNYLPDARNQILLVGYQSVGSRGWRLQNGEDRIKIFGEWVPVKASVEKLEGFSGHADYEEIDLWLEGLEGTPQTTFLTHGDPDALEAQRKRLTGRGWSVVVPEHLQEVELPL
ncbi:MAG: MBL fold metallo-hydrolase [Candidatus Eremiobacteraeota bacterium]|nr:MBL fold metallo-hydrolase [Candidatus Eremiobacteraeota bacterium]